MERLCDSGSTYLCLLALSVGIMSRWNLAQGSPLSLTSTQKNAVRCVQGRGYVYFGVQCS